MEKLLLFYYKGMSQANMGLLKNSFYSFSPLGMYP
jgi:hypothetical protein